VIVFGSSFSEHIQRLETVLQRILDAGLKLKPEKCTIAIVAHSGLIPLDADKLEVHYKGP
jgi:broad specificity phosphatase PhoE